MTTRFLLITFFFFLVIISISPSKALACTDGEQGPTCDSSWCSDGTVCGQGHQYCLADGVSYGACSEEVNNCSDCSTSLPSGDGVCVLDPSTCGACSCTEAGCDGLQDCDGRYSISQASCTGHQSCNTTPNTDSCGTPAQGGSCDMSTHNSVPCDSGSQCTGVLGDGCGYCQSPDCNNNNVQDNGETGIDCGGGGCGVCPTPPPSNPPPGGGSSPALQAPAAPTVTVAATCSSTNKYSGSEVTIRWADTNIIRVDIAGDSFTRIAAWNYYNKNIAAGTTSTKGPKGFFKETVCKDTKGIPIKDCIPPSLTLNGDQTMYVRIWNGTQYSAETTFSIPCNMDCSGYNLFNAPIPNQQLIFGQTYKLQGWSTFCSGPNYTNRDRVDMYLYKRGSWAEADKVANWYSVPSELRQDVINATWTCGDYNANDDGWYRNWTVDKDQGNYTLRVASINDRIASCVKWASRDISIILRNCTASDTVTNGTCTRKAGVAANSCAASSGQRTDTYSGSNCTTTTATVDCQMTCTAPNSCVSGVCSAPPACTASDRTSTGNVCNRTSGTGAAGDSCSAASGTYTDTYPATCTAPVNPRTCQAPCATGYSCNTSTSTCILAAPTISTLLTCIPSGYNGSGYTISWGSVTPAVTYVDISTSDTFSSYYHKAVSGTSTTAPGGFNLDPSNPPVGLTLDANTTYYVRLWNGTNSARAYFTTPDFCPLQASCKASPNSIYNVAPNNYSIWSVTPSGGDGTYTKSWTFTGYPEYSTSLPNTLGDILQSTRIYYRAGTDNAAITVTSGTQNVTANCSLIINSATAPWIQVTGDVHSNGRINAPGGP